MPRPDMKKGRQLCQGSGEGRIRTSDTDRNDFPQVRRSVNVLPMIIVKSHGTLIFINVAN